MDKSNQLLALKNSAIAKKQDANNRVKSALEQMQQHEIPINFQSVARCASVSKSWLYKQTNIANQIKSLRTKSGKINRSLSNAKQMARKNAKIDALEQRVRSLALENKDLKQQVEVIYSELHKHVSDVEI